MDAPTAWIVVGLGFGDCGKGTTVDALVRRLGARRVVRFNGGAQAGHNVVLPDGRHHTFAQLGAGSFVDGVGTHLASTVVVHPSALRVEAQYLARAGVPDALTRTTIAPECRVNTPFHQAAGRLRELLRGEAVHGTCGVGVGETVRDALAHPSDVLTMAELWRDDVRAKLRRIRERLAEALLPQVSALADASNALAAERAVLEEDDALAERWLAHVRGLESEGVRLRTDAEIREEARDEPLVFEGAQGVLLDEHHGFHPHTTWSTCTPAHALAFLDGAPHAIRRLGVLRTTLTRHGAGPLPSEDVELGRALPEPHNDARGWQGRFRVGWPDPILTRYAIAACGGLEALAVTHVDRVATSRLRFVEAHRVDGEDHTALPSCSDADPLGAQEHRTRWLMRALPVLADLPARTGEAFVDWVERTYALPVAVASYGPTHADKVFRAPE